MTKRQLRKEFPGALKECRRKLGFTQLLLAKSTGISQSWISHFERGERLPDAHALITIHRAIGVIDELKTP